jgi:hypothetical protein
MLSGSVSSVGTVCARNPRSSVLRRHDRGDLFFQTGAGPFGAIVVGFVTAGFTLVVGQYAVFAARSPIGRLLIRLLFAVPAARAGYDVTLALAHFGIPQEWWRESFAMLGAIAVGCTAWVRVSILTEPALRPGIAFGPARPPIGATTKGR